mmetsp:Transcript_94705/g.244567  ORF Transcript_94705/g.244567 Transcript_94705/m.244567 type:complete len:298 (+) Transcript_94705:816-1709(+)
MASSCCMFTRKLLFSCGCPMSWQTALTINAIDSIIDISWPHSVRTRNMACVTSTAWDQLWYPLPCTYPAAACDTKAWIVPSSQVVLSSRTQWRMRQTSCELCALWRTMVSGLKTQECRSSSVLPSSSMMSKRPRLESDERGPSDPISPMYSRTWLCTGVVLCIMSSLSVFIFSTVLARSSVSDDLSLFLNICLLTQRPTPSPMANSGLLVPRPAPSLTLICMCSMRSCMAVPWWRTLFRICSTWTIAVEKTVQEISQGRTTIRLVAKRRQQRFETASLRRASEKSKTTVKAPAATCT